MQNQSENRILVSVNEALRLIEIGRTSFYAEVAAGRIEIRHAGRRTLVPLAALERWAANLKRGNAEVKP